MVYSDMTFVGNKLVGFDAQKGWSQDYNSEPKARIYINEYSNGLQADRTALYILWHKFGHCNTVDYNPLSDCLILGNGSGSYTLDGDIIIIPGFSEVVNVSESSEVPLTLEDVNALVIHCSEYKFGTKFNLVWAGTNDTAYLITAKNGNGDLETIRKIRFCKNNEQGNFGIYQTNMTPFNGTFNIEETFIQNTNGYDDCIQGACYYNSDLYACVGHGMFRFWQMTLNNGSIYRKDYIDNQNIVSDMLNYGSSTGICEKDGVFFIGRVGIGVAAFSF